MRADVTLAKRGGLASLLIIAALLSLAGCASKNVWSGYWWPTAPGTSPNLFDNAPTDPFIPCKKYDAYVVSLGKPDPGFCAWEKAKHYTPACGWCGHCHAWSAASILEIEPVKPVTKNGITFNVGELKGLLTELYYAIPSDYFLGTRCDSTSDTAAYDDPSPAQLHKFLTWWGGNKWDGKAEKWDTLVFDTNPGPEVWNYVALWWYVRTDPDPSDPTKYNAQLLVLLVSDGVAPDYVGRQPFQKTYTYWIKGTPSNPTTGGWTGASVSDHPDFVWHPAYQQAAAGCPLDYQTVTSLLPAQP